MHISQIAKSVLKVSDYLAIGQEVIVKVLEIDRQGRIRLTMKELTKDQTKNEENLLQSERVLGSK